jgi:D-arabinose 1-dehydrogenase-like Zn-dependent alcohol dehydrogenase
MRAMVLERPRTPLVMRERSAPEPGSGEILIEVAACGVCRTDLHVVDGELPNPKLPIVPGHEIVGRVAALGAGVAGLAIGERVGVPWLGFTCGVCPYCRSGRENLCDRPLFTGYTRDGGYATRALGALVPMALKAVKKGGRVVCGGIYMSDIPSFPYRLLWEERQVVSVANLTRAGAREFLTLAPQAGVRSEVTRYPLEAANEALADLREGRLQGAAVLIP